MSRATQKRRVAVTGMGLVGPTGIGSATFWDHVLNGGACFRLISRFDAASYSCRIAGEVEDRSCDQFLDARSLRASPHVVQLALAASQLAKRDAHFIPGQHDPERVGVSIGTALGGWREAEQQHSVLLARGAKRVNPFIANATPNHAVGAEVAALLGAQGPQVTFSSGCTAGLHALGHGALLIERGELDVCFAGGAESPLIPMVLAGMGRTLELSTLNEEPQRASRPFDRRHSGMVLSEGSCILVLEAEENVMRRGAVALAEILGFASSCDAQGLYGIDPTGRAGARAVHRALALADALPTDIDYVCAHANSSPVFDRKDALVIKAAFGEWAARLPVSSIKGVLGHPFGASGAFQAAAACLSIRDQLIPPTHNLETPDPECDLSHVRQEPLSTRIRRTLITSHGYGGANAYLVVGAADV